jgi:DNA polymerase-3 subunit alpha
MAKMKDKMIEGGQKHSGIDRALMEKFWKQLEDFAAYCFNKSHAACYGLIAYQTAYLKAHYPAAFMAALMTSDFDDTDRLAIEITECKHMGINVLPPDVNESFVEFAVVPDGKPTADPIRFGLNAIKNVGTGAVEEILRARELDGSFTSVEDFLSKVNVRIVNRKAMESLIKSGAFDRFGSRGKLLNNIEVLLAFASRLQKEAIAGQTDLFGNLIEDSAVKSVLILKEDGEVYPERQQLLWERELLGLYLSQHPLQQFENLLSELAVPLNSIAPEHDGKTVTIGGAITDMREITTKNGQKMAFVKIADQFGEKEMILFPSIYQQTTGIWERDRVVLAKGKVSAKDKDGNQSSEVKILVDDVREITPEQATAYQPTGKKPRTPKPGKKTKATVTKNTVSLTEKPSEKVYLRLPGSDNQALLMSLKETIDQNAGDTEVILVVGQEASKQIIRLPMRLNMHEESLGALKSVVGEMNVRVQ